MIISIILYTLSNIMDIFYYSNYCKHSQKVLQTLVKGDIVSKIRISDQDINYSLTKLKEMAEKKLIQIKLSKMNHIDTKRFKQRRKHGNHTDSN